MESALHRVADFVYARHAVASYIIDGNLRVFLRKTTREIEGEQLRVIAFDYEWLDPALDVESKCRVTAQLLDELEDAARKSGFQAIYIESVTPSGRAALTRRFDFTAVRQNRAKENYFKVQGWDCWRKVQGAMRPVSKVLDELVKVQAAALAFLFPTPSYNWSMRSGSWMSPSSVRNGFVAG